MGTAKSGMIGALLPEGRAAILERLRRGAASVNDLAIELEVTPNAIRSHLATLGRDRLVETHGQRKGTRRPEVLYRLTAEADELFPKAYALLLRQTLETLSTEMTQRKFEGVVERIGRDLAAQVKAVSGAPKGSTKNRAEAGVALLEEIGGAGILEKSEAGYRFTGSSCPLAAVAPDHPAVCHLACSLLTELTGLSVTEACDRSERPGCIFEFTPAL